MKSITIQTKIMAPLSKVWDAWTQPQHITNWNFASPEWCCPSAENDLREGGKFSSRMEARDGSMGFDFWGIHKKVVLHQTIESEMGDGRAMAVNFAEEEGITTVTESFDVEDENSIEMQRQGWQAILDNFKHYVEGGVTS